jgi:Tfp pilus assembly protein PilF
MNELSRFLLLLLICIFTGCASLPFNTAGRPSKDSPQTYAERKQAAIASYERQRDAAHVHSAVNAWQRGEVQQARAVLTDVVERSPQDLTARLRLAELLISEEETAAAEEQLRACLAIAPDSAEVNHALGLLLSDLPGRETEAHSHLRRASELEPENELYAAVAE